MKIAVLGNMNNNGFTLMRYLRDIGLDAHLLLYINDGIDSLKHFSPENDTFHLDNWEAFIHQTEIINGHYGVIPEFFQRPFAYLFNTASRLKGRSIRIVPLSRIKIKEKLVDYDFIISSGFSPAILWRAGLKCSIFSPYSSGIEGINRDYAPYSPVSRLIWEYARQLQIKGLLNARCIVNAEMGITKDQLNNLDLNFYAIPMPIVYVEKKYRELTYDKFIDEVGMHLNDVEFSILMHSRLAWNDKICKKNKTRSKNNHWVINAYKELLSMKNSIKSKLVILEYGPDVDNTKKLVNELGLDSHVIWIPKTSRKNIMWLLRKVSIGVGEFIESPRTIWGGTGWEVLASGKPLLQGFHFEKGEFQSLLGFPPPPMLSVRTEKEILEHMLFVINYPEAAAKIGESALQWFNTYNGIAITKKWAELISYTSTSLKD
jgi:hypothetical protein